MEIKRSNGKARNSQNIRRIITKADDYTWQQYAVFKRKGKKKDFNRNIATQLCIWQMNNIPTGPDQFSAITTESTC